MSRCRIIFFMFIALYCAMTVEARGKKSDIPVFTLVLDAGHGGHDVGCRGRTQKEKDVTLDVVRRACRLITKQLGDSVNVILTRDNDTFVPLDRRASIANEADADLFISVHVNSLDRRAKGRNKIQGASVYTVGLHKSDANLAVAMRENAVIELEDDYTETYQGFDPGSTESYIIFELVQNRHMAKSIEMASLVLDGLVESAGRADKGVRQAGFLVLWATRMPSILVELDFMCNPQVEKFLGSDSGRQKCAKAISDAFISYFHRYKKTSDSNSES